MTRKAIHIFLTRRNAWMQSLTSSNNNDNAKSALNAMLLKQGGGEQEQPREEEDGNNNDTHDDPRGALMAMLNKRGNLPPPTTSRGATPPSKAVYNNNEDENDDDEPCDPRQALSAMLMKQQGGVGALTVTASDIGAMKSAKTTKNAALSNMLANRSGDASQADNNASIGKGDNGRPALKNDPK